MISSATYPHSAASQTNRSPLTSQVKFGQRTISEVEEKVVVHEGRPPIRWTTGKVASLAIVSSLTTAFLTKALSGDGGKSKETISKIQNELSAAIKKNSGWTEEKISRHAFLGSMPFMLLKKVSQLQSVDMIKTASFLQVPQYILQGIGSIAGMVALIKK